VALAVTSPLNPEQACSALTFHSPFFLSHEYQCAIKRESQTYQAALVKVSLLAP
jgi:hypothetical protein